MAKLRASRYLVLSPSTYCEPDGQRVRLAYSVRRASLFTLRADVAEKIARDDLEEIDTDQIEQLCSRGALVDQDEHELTSVLDGYRERAADPSIRNFSVLPTSYCNMACSYCGQDHVKGKVTPDWMEGVAARVEAAFADDSVREVSIGWFGGEPMLALSAMRQLSERFQIAADRYGKTFSSRMPTNGSLLSRSTLRTLYDVCRLRAVDVTLDGPEDIHNRRRLKRNGVGSFKRTVEVLAEAVRTNAVPELSIGIRVNVDRENEEHISDLLIDLACAGLTSPQVALHLMPVHSWGNDVSSVELAARRYAELEIGWLNQARALGLSFPVIPNAIRRSTCRATTTFAEVIDPNGQVYSCSEHPLVPGARAVGVVATLSDLAGSAPRPHGMYDDWYDEIGHGSQQCARCPLLPVCGGACPKQWREGNVPCPSIKYNLSSRLDIAASQLGLQPVPA